MSSTPADSPLDPPLPGSWLEEHGAFLRTLARKLVGGEAEVEDLVQDTWLKVLSKQIEAPHKPRPWLVRLLVNRSTEVKRMAARRRYREARTARREVTDQDDDSLETGSFLLERVRALPKEQRRVLMARYFQGHALAQIAEQQGLSVGQVRGHLKRGLEHLRADLDQRSDGDREAWCIGMVGCFSFEGVSKSATLAASLSPGPSALLTGALTMSTLKLTGAVIAIALLVFLNRQQDLPEQSLSADPQGPAEESLALEVASVPTAAREALDSTTETGLEGTSLAVEDPVSGALSSTPPRQRAYGTIRLQDPDGSLHTEPDGVLWLTFYRNQQPFETAVVAGQFDYQWNGGSTPILRGARLNGAGCVLDLDDARGTGTLEDLKSDETLRLPAGEHHLLFRSQGLFTLNVLDSETLQHLRDVEVLQTFGWEFGGYVPDPKLRRKLLVDGESSPVRFPAGVGPADYWVRAEGYAWWRVRVNHDFEVEHDMTLEASAEILLQITPNLAGGLPPTLDVRLYPGGFEGNDPAYSRALIDGEGRAQFKSIRAGAYQVRIEAGEFPDIPVTLVLMDLTLSPGETRRINLDLSEDLGVREAVTVSGIIRLGSGMEATDVELEMRRATTSALYPADEWRGRVSGLRATDEANSFAFSFEGVSTGRIKFGIYPFRQSWVFDLPRGGLHDLVLETRDTAPVEVVVVDGATGQTLPVEGISWSPYAPGLFQEMDRPRGSLVERYIEGREHPTADSKDWVVRFQPLIGSLSIQFWHEGYGGEMREVLVKAGTTNRFRLELNRIPILELGFVDIHGHPVEGYGWTMESEIPGQEWDYARPENGRHIVKFEEAGRWTVVGAPRGWRAISSGRVSVDISKRWELLVTVEPDQP